MYSRGGWRHERGLRAGVGSSIACHGQTGLNKAVVYATLFQAAAEALSTIAADQHHLGAELGFIAVLAHLGPEPAA
jgi:hypothetical protein